MGQPLRHAPACTPLPMVKADGYGIEWPGGACPRLPSSPGDSACRQSPKGMRLRRGRHNAPDRRLLADPPHRDRCASPRGSHPSLGDPAVIESWARTWRSLAPPHRHRDVPRGACPGTTSQSIVPSPSAGPGRRVSRTSTRRSSTTRAATCRRSVLRRRSRRPLPVQRQRARGNGAAVERRARFTVDPRAAPESSCRSGFAVVVAPRAQEPAAACGRASWRSAPWRTERR